MILPQSVIDADIGYGANVRLDILNAKLGASQGPVGGRTEYRMTVFEAQAADLRMKGARIHQHRNRAGLGAAFKGTGC